MNNFQDKTCVATFYKMWNSDLHFPIIFCQQEEKTLHKKLLIPNLNRDYTEDLKDLVMGYIWKEIKTNLKDFFNG